MAVEQIQQLRLEVGWPYRRLVVSAELAYSSFMRWRGRQRRGEEMTRKPGPQKMAMLARDRLTREIRDLRHGRKRSGGTGILYRRYRDQISRRDLNILVKTTRADLWREHAAQMLRIHWQIPGLAWAMDDAVYRGCPLHQVQDLASRYKFDPLAGETAVGEKVAAHLERLFEDYGPPLVLKRDRGRNLRHQAVEDILESYRVLPLDSPTYYPCYNGGIERGQREIKEYLADQPGDSPGIPAQVHAGVQVLNHRPRPCLEGQTSCAVLSTGQKTMRVYTHQKRKEVFGWIQEQAQTMLLGMKVRNTTAQDAAWRRAMEMWLHLNGAITVSRNGKVLPCFPEIRSHN